MLLGCKSPMAATHVDMKKEKKELEMTSEGIGRTEISLPSAASNYSCGSLRSRGREHRAEVVCAIAGSQGSAKKKIKIKEEAKDKKR